MIDIIIQKKIFKNNDCKHAVKNLKIRAKKSSDLYLKTEGESLHSITHQQQPAH